MSFVASMSIRTSHALGTKRMEVVLALLIALRCRSAHMGLCRKGSVRPFSVQKPKRPSGTPRSRRTAEERTAFLKARWGRLPYDTFRPAATRPVRHSVNSMRRRYGLLPLSAGSGGRCPGRGTSRAQPFCPEGGN